MEQIACAPAGLPKKERGTVLELMRLLAALWVMEAHSFYLFKDHLFSSGYLAPDFFFMLSGFFLLPGLLAAPASPLIKGGLHFLWRRFKPLAHTFIICWLFALSYYSFLRSQGQNIGIFHYLWYVPEMFKALAVYYVLAYFVKNKKILWLLFGAVLIYCYGRYLLTACSNGSLRAFGGIALGLLLSQLPKFPVARRQPLAVVVAVASVLAVALMALLSVPGTPMTQLCCLLAFPLGIYGAAQVSWSNKWLNGVCRLSFGLYAYQTVARFMMIHHYIRRPGWAWLFIVFLATVDVLLCLLLKKWKKFNPGRR